MVPGVPGQGRTSNNSTFKNGQTRADLKWVVPGVPGQGRTRDIVTPMTSARARKSTGQNMLDDTFMDEAVRMRILLLIRWRETPRLPTRSHS